MFLVVFWVIFGYWKREEKRDNVFDGDRKRKECEKSSIVFRGDREVRGEDKRQNKEEEEKFRKRG